MKVNTYGLGIYLSWQRKKKMRDSLKHLQVKFMVTEIHPQPETYFGNVNTVGPRSCYDESQKRFAETLTNNYHTHFASIQESFEYLTLMGQE